MIDQLAPRITFRYLLHPLAAQNDQLLDRMPPGSVVVNATGMGKDRPGSPITDAALFPSNAVAWELNYRGDLPFLQQAQKQQASANFNGCRWLGGVLAWLDRCHFPSTRSPDRPCNI
ncbi:MAG: hypothetical protein R2932_32515 [Caldilineaceae bacterium]